MYLHFILKFKKEVSENLILTWNSTWIGLYRYHVTNKLPKTSPQVDTDTQLHENEQFYWSTLKTTIKHWPGGWEGIESAQSTSFQRSIRTAPAAAEGRGPWRVVCWLETTCTEQDSPETHKEPAALRYHCSSYRSEHRKHQGCHSEITENLFLKFCLHNVEEHLLGSTCLNSHFRLYIEWYQYSVPGIRYFL